MSVNLRVILAVSLLSASTAFAQTTATFSTPKNITPPNFTQWKLADLNSNDRPDLVGLDPNTNAVVVFRNTGGGNFASADTVVLPFVPSDFAIADFNGDGKLDVAVSLAGTNTSPVSKVAILLGNGDGTLHNPVLHTVNGAPNSIAVGDFNNDGRPDIATLFSNSTNNVVTVLSNAGAGNFTESSFAVAGDPNFSGLGDFDRFLVAGDFNGDGRMDLAFDDSCVNCDVSEDAIKILTNTAAGFVLKNTTAGFSGTTGITVADLDGDGRADFIVPFAGCHTPCVGVEVAFNNANGTQTVTQLPVPNGQDGPIVFQTVAADLNNDGKTDLAGFSTSGLDQNFNPISPSIFGWFAAGVRGPYKLKMYTPSNPSQSGTTILTGLITADGKPDLIVPHDPTLQLWINSTPFTNDPCRHPGATGLNVCAPAASVTHGSVRFLAASRPNPQPQNRIELWIDGHKKFQVFSDRLDHRLTIAAGTHTATFISVAANGALLKKSVTFTAH